MKIGVTSINISGVGKSTISLAPSVELSMYGLVVLFESTGYFYRLVRSSTLDDLENVRKFGNLILAGVSDNPLMTCITEHTILKMPNFV